MDVRTVLVALTFAGVARCAILEGPAHTAVRLGEKTTLKCEVSTEDKHLAYWQAQKVADKEYHQIYYSVSGPMVPWVESIEDQLYDIVITDGSYNKSGKYKCDYLSATIFSMTAELMTVGEMDCGEAGVVHREGANVGFTCSVLLTGAMNPTLTWYQGDREVRGGRYIEHILLEDLDKISAENRTAVDQSGVIVLDNTYGAVSPEIKRAYFSEEGEEAPPVWKPRKVVFYQNITVDHSADGEAFTCRLHFSEGSDANPEPPTYTDSCTTSIGVTYGATSIEIDPNPSDWSGSRTPDGVMEMNVGDKFSCSARGNPPPMIIWYKMENSVGISRPEGADLVITEEMRGLNHYNCTALNEPHGQERRAYRAIKFHVGGYSVDTGESKGQGSGTGEFVSTTSLVLAGLIAVLGLVNYHKH